MNGFWPDNVPLPPSTNKRVLVYRFDRQPIPGFVNPADYLRATYLEMITNNGVVERLGYKDVKAVCFVSEEGKANLFSEHTVFGRRPRLAGVWARFLFRDGDELEGVLPHDLTDWPEPGYSIVPPRAGADRQRVFLPRLALQRAEVLGVVGAGKRAPVQKKATELETRQLPMF